MADALNNRSVLFLDGEGKIKSWNNESEKIYGYSSNEVLGEYLGVFYTLADQEKKLPGILMQQARELGKSIVEGWQVKKDGTIFWSEAILTALQDDENIFIGFSRISHDLTERRKQIEFDHSNLDALINNTDDMIWSVNRNYKLITANNAFNEIVKIMSGSPIGKGDDVLAIGFSKEQLARYKEFYDRAFAGATFTEIEYTAPPYESWSEISFYPIRLGDTITGTACYAHDITKRKQDEHKIIHANRLYAFISQINQAIVRIRGESQLYRAACDIAVKFGQFKVAWVGLINFENKTVSLAAQTGFDESDVHLFHDTTYDQPGPVQHVLNTGSYYTCNNIQEDFKLPAWKRFGDLRGIRSIMVVPLKRGGQIIGTFNLCSGYTDFFKTEEIALLVEVTSDLSFALDIFEKDRARVLAEEKLMDSTFRMKQAEEMAHFGSWYIDFATGIGIWGEETCRIYGLALEDNKHSYESWLSFIHPDDIDYVMAEVRKEHVTPLGTNMYHRIVRRDGTVRHINSLTEFEFRDDKPIGLYGVVHDITEQTSNIIQLKEQNKQLREIADIQSHNVRGPLATILGLAQLIKDKDAGTNTEEIIDGILASSQKLDTVIREIVDKTHVSTGVGL